MLTLFGHQSVGCGILDGVREHVAAGRPGPRVVPLEELDAGAGPDAIVAFRVGRNREPLAKLAHFDSVVRDRPGARAQAALLKFCYADIDHTTDVDALFCAYRDMFGRLRSACPWLALAHVTVPLRAVCASPLRRLRRWLGDFDRQVSANAARDDFNRRLRSELPQGDLLFDLAAIESRGAGRHACFAVGDGRRIPALAPEFTDDGGHLNPRGRRIVAREFLEFLERLFPAAPVRDGVQGNRP